MGAVAPSCAREVQVPLTSSNEIANVTCLTEARNVRGSALLGAPPVCNRRAVQVPLPWSDPRSQALVPRTSSRGDEAAPDGFVRRTGRARHVQASTNGGRSEAHRQGVRRAVCYQVRVQHGLVCAARCGSLHLCVTTAVGRSAAAAARTRKDGGHGCGTPDACAYLAGSEGARRVVNTLVGLWDGAGVPPRSIVLWRQVRSSLSRVAVASRPPAWV